MLRPLTLALAFSSLAVAADPFAEGVRKTEPLTPDKQRAAFRLPPGFEIQLVAAEPDLRKPMNMAFDALGRLWVTESREYPFPAKPGTPARDSVRIFSDFGPDGRARKVEVFADELNIPIGLYPFRTGRTWKCIVWSIPNIWLMEDTDGDGKADKREVLFGPLGWEKDTHGNQASFRRGADGWLYGTHGFNNESTYRATDGSTIKLHSGNTWRIRVNGSRVEQHTWGQVNPFGLCWDDRGNLFSADCHSSPIYQLLRGATYPSFGKPHDGLGYAPQTIQHSHGSTAICGPMMITDPAWPAELQGNMLVGNVMTSRLNQDAIEWRGASSKGKELADFLTSEDPWFRPVDLQWGPDGALYIADFYNRIIGHYEVPLQHPGRDRERGRIWRVVNRGKLLPGALPEDAAGLVKELASGNPTRRSLALNELCDRHGDEAISLLKAALAEPVNPHQAAGALWALQRMGDLPEESLAKGVQHPDALVRTHAVRVADARKDWSPALEGLVRAALQDADAIVRRVATEALASHPATENFQPLLDLLLRTPKEDDHLIHSARIALRDHLRAGEVASRLSLDSAKPEELRALLAIMLAVQGEQTALLRLSLFERTEVAPEEIAKQLPSMVKNLPVDRIPSVVKLGRKHLHDPDAAASVLQGLAEVLAQRAVPASDEVRAWGGEVAAALLASEVGKSGWTALNADGAPAAESAWAFQERACADGAKAQVMSSFPPGEKRTGILRSAAFAVPEKLRFYLCGHDGEPGRPPAGKNFIRLRDADGGAVLRQTPPPRNDTAQRIEWDLKEFAGRRAYFEATDGHDGSAYAWLAFGRFKPELPELALIEPSTIGKRQALGAELASAFGHTPSAARLAELLAHERADVAARAAASQALIALDREKGVSLVAQALANPGAPMPLREKLAAALGGASHEAAEAALLEALAPAPHKLQQAIAAALSSSKGGANRLMAAISEGKASPTLLRDKALADRLKAQRPDAAEQIKVLTANLPPANAEADRLISERRSAFATAKADEKRGATVFTQHCGVCHQIGQTGNLVGPQLDGIGSRGLDRILEDIIDPNRNVDRAFRMSVVTLNDGGVVSGLFRREEGATLVLADLTGKEQSVPIANVKSRTESETSLMPPVFTETIPPADFADLLAYLLAQKATH